MTLNTMTSQLNLNMNLNLNDTAITAKQRKSIDEIISLKEIETSLMNRDKMDKYKQLNMF